MLIYKFLQIIKVSVKFDSSFIAENVQILKATNTELYYRKFIILLSYDQLFPFLLPQQQSVPRSCHCELP